ncbi:hypothetical protein LCGC14_1220020, partial [marine sediment metagenome]
MRKLFEAIYSKFEADTALAAAVTNLYNTYAPPKAVFPYIVFALISNTIDLDSSQNWEDYIIQFNIFDDSPSSGTLSDIYELLKGDTAAGTGFDYFNLLIDDYTTVVLERESATLVYVDKVWQYNVTYSLRTVYSGESAVEKYCIHIYNLMGI